MKDFKELKVWEKAHALTLLVYEETRTFPKQEVYGLTSQLRRAAASVAANIVEGCGRRSDGEFTRFLQIARGSASELEYHILLARDVQLLTEAVYGNLDSKVVEVERMLTGLVKKVRPISVQKRITSPPTPSTEVARS
jgi:four helix bundle protein